MRTKEIEAARLRAYYAANKEKVKAKVRANKRKLRQELSDATIAQEFFGVKQAQYHLIPQELIEAKRLQILIAREVKQQGA